MSVAPTKKLAVACELLDRSLKLYYEGDSYFSALHLAGAAEEILGVYVECNGGESSFRSLQHGAVRISKIINGGIESTPRDIAAAMNRAKNSTKHMDKQGDEHVEFDAEAEAHDLLDRAVSNYYYLMSFYELPETALVHRFNSELTREA